MQFNKACTICLYRNKHLNTFVESMNDVQCRINGFNIDCMSRVYLLNRSSTNKVYTLSNSNQPSKPMANTLKHGYWFSPNITTNVQCSL